MSVACTNSDNKSSNLCKRRQIGIKPMIIIISPGLNARRSPMSHLLGLPLVPDVVVQEVEQLCAWSRKLDPNFCPGRVEPRTLASSGRGCCTRLRRTPPFSRLLRHAGGYSWTILTPNLQGLTPNLQGYFHLDNVICCFRE